MRREGGLCEFVREINVRMRQQESQKEGISREGKQRGERDHLQLQREFTLREKIEFERAKEDRGREIERERQRDCV